MERKSNDDTLRSQDLETSLDISNLLYLEKKESNVVVERSQKITYSDSPTTQSNGGVVVLNLQTGSDYISFKDSFMRVVFNSYTSAGGVPGGSVGFGASGSAFGSVLNCLQTVRVVSRSGDIIAQIDKSNLLNYYKVNYERTAQWKLQQGALIGYGLENVPQGSEFLIPMQMLCPFFEGDQLSPNMLCRGMRLEITTAPALEALTQTGDVDAVASFVLSGVQLHLDSYELTSGALNWLNNRSSNNGLVMTYCDYENSHFEKPVGQSSYSYEIRKTASMANSAMTIFRNKRTSERKEDSFKATTIGTNDTMQYRVASMYMPIQPIRGATQIYNQQQYVLDRLRNGKELGVTLAEFSAGLGVHPVILDRYFLEGSGLAINQSSTLSIQGENDSVAAKDVDIFLKHTRSLTIFLNNLRRSD